MYDVGFLLRSSHFLLSNAERTGVRNPAGVFPFAPAGYLSVFLAAGQFILAEKTIEDIMNSDMNKKEWSRR